MRAAVYRGPRDVRIEEIARPEPGPDELLLRVHANGICGTDASEFAAGPQMYPLHARHPLTGHEGPIVPGHEFCGYVAGFGRDVRGFAEGELVVTGAALWCGECRQCKAGRTSICAKYATVGLHRDGGLAEYVTLPAAVAVKADPYGLAPDVAALTQPMAIAVHALRRGAPERGQDVLVVGAGGIGAFLTYALAQAGARVVAVDLLPEREAIARRLGGFARPDDFVPTLVFEVTGTEEGLATCVASIDPGGRMVYVGIAKHALAIDARRVTVKELEIVGTNSLIRAQDVPEAARLLSREQSLWREVAPLAIPLDRLVDDGIAPMVEGHARRIKTLVDPWTTHERPTVMTR